MLEIQNISKSYGSKKALQDCTITANKHDIVGILGQNGCGKSTFLRLFNRMNDLISGTRLEGTIQIDGRDIYAKGEKVDQLRKNVGMVFQKPNPFPKSIYENVAYGLRVNGISDENYIEETVLKTLQQAALWNEVKDKLNNPGTSLSGGQQQRLCIARTIAIRPEVILMDEPTSALDPISTEKIEALMLELKQDYTIITVTHNMQQAARVADYTAFFHLGKLIEYDETETIFVNPHNKKTEDYITGRFG